MQAAVPDVGDIAGEQGPRLAPVGAVVIAHPAGGARSHRLARRPLGPVAPIGVVGHPVGRVGDHEGRHHARQQARDVGGAGGVAAQQPVRAQAPQVARSRYRNRRPLRHLVRVGQAGRRGRGQQPVQLAVVKAGEREVEAVVAQLVQLQRQQLVVPLRPRRRAVGQQAERLDLRRRQVVGQHHRDRGQAQPLRRLEPQMAVDHRAVRAGHDRDAEAELADRPAHPLDRVIVLARIARVGDQPRDRPVLDHQAHATASIRGTLCATVSQTKRSTIRRS